MHKIGVNINQLTKVANTVGTATPQDIPCWARRRI
ncbi:plasmid mobilization relaxosome protein MobC [Oscillospiraceae bacterium NTUH-002-81]|nr:plasmid mobilization relaxosome protein MobC [Oscillospiraceae bacterium NTUH-002-81]